MLWVWCSGVPWHDLPERYGFWKRFITTLIGGLNLVALTSFSTRYFHYLMHMVLLMGLYCADGSHIRALKCAAGAQKNILMSPEIMGWITLTVVLAPKSIWQQPQGGLPLNIVLSSGQAYESPVTLRLWIILVLSVRTAV